MPGRALNLRTALRNGPRGSGGSSERSSCKGVVVNFLKRRRLEATEGGRIKLQCLECLRKYESCEPSDLDDEDGDGWETPSLLDAVLDPTKAQDFANPALQGARIRHPNNQNSLPMTGE